jgi:hypothetical protein
MHMSENNQNPGVHSGSNDKQKRAKFRELARHDRICAGSRFFEDWEQLFFPFDEFKQENRDAAVRSGSRAAS